ncbi:hypothetical protein ACTHQ4_10395 [Alkalicoccobacillus gibsonii]|uniref:hypothetical protein n=1 Tax=Alkalicoccobacillus gibsonii TaxID=79881 RepID=UPI003F7C3D32
MIEVLYKDYNINSGELELRLHQFECWDQEGEYTKLYKKYPQTNADILVPTANVCWIKPLETI